MVRQWANENHFCGSIITTSGPHLTEYDLSGFVSGGTALYPQLNHPVAIKICQTKTGAVRLALRTTAAP